MITPVVTELKRLSPHGDRVVMPITQARRSVAATTPGPSPLAAQHRR